MTCAVIGATGRIGSAVVRGLLADRQPVIALVRDSGKAHELFGTDGNLQVRETLIAREWALLAGENERVTPAVTDLTGHAPRSVEAFLHENRELFR